MDDSTRQAIAADVRAHGRAFGVLENGKIKRIPPDKVITFDDEGATVAGELDRAPKLLREASHSYVTSLRKSG